MYSSLSNPVSQGAAGKAFPHNVSYADVLAGRNTNRVVSDHSPTAAVCTGQPNGHQELNKSEDTALISSSCPTASDDEYMCSSESLSGSSLAVDLHLTTEKLKGLALGSKKGQGINEGDQEGEDGGKCQDGSKGEPMDKSGNECLGKNTTCQKDSAKAGQYPAATPPRRRQRNRRRHRGGRNQNYHRYANGSSQSAAYPVMYPSTPCVPATPGRSYNPSHWPRAGLRQIYESYHPGQAPSLPRGIHRANAYAHQQWSTPFWHSQALPPPRPLCHNRSSYQSHIFSWANSFSYPLRAGAALWNTPQNTPHIAIDSNVYPSQSTRGYYTSQAIPEVGSHRLNQPLGLPSEATQLRVDPQTPAFVPGRIYHNAGSGSSGSLQSSTSALTSFEVENEYMVNTNNKPYNGKEVEDQQETASDESVIEGYVYAFDDDYWKDPESFYPSNGPRIGRAGSTSGRFMSPWPSGPENAPARRVSLSTITEHEAPS